MAKESNELSGSPAQLPPVPETRYELQVLRSLRRIIRAIDIHSRRLKSSFQLTAPQLICLLCVVEEGPLNATAISQNVFLSPSTIVGILDRLESRGLVTRERDSDDRRVVKVTASAQGVELARTAPSPLQDNLANALRKLPELEQATIALSLKRIVDLMEAEQLEAAPILETDQPDMIAAKDAGNNNATVSDASKSKPVEERE